MVTEEAANHGKLGSAGSPGQCLASGAPRSESAGGLRADSWGRVGSCQFESLNWLGCVVCVSSSAQAARTPPHFTKTTHNTQHTHFCYIPYGIYGRLPHGECFLAHGFELQRYENAADAVFSTPHSCLTTLCPTHCSPAHANLCPIRMHRLILGLIHSDKFIPVYDFKHVKS